MKCLKVLLVIISVMFTLAGPQIVMAAYYPIIFLHGIGDGSNALGWETWGNGTSAMYKIIHSNYRGYTAGIPINSNICSQLPPTGGEVRKIYNFSYYNVDGARGVIGSGKLADGRPRLVPEVYDWMVDYQISANSGCWAQYCSTFVERVCQATGSSKVNIIAHSMGGLVARSYIKWYGGSLRVHKLITVGCPHHGFQSPFQERIYSQFSGHWGWQKRGEDLEMDVDPSIAGASVSFLDRSNNNVEGRWPDFLGYDELGVGTATIAGTFSTIWFPEHPNDGTVEVSSAHLGGEQFKPNVYLNHSLRTASWEELAECTSTFTTEFIKKWMIDEDYSYTGASYLPRGPVFWSNESGTVWPNTWCTREVRLQPAVNNYQRVLCTQVALHDLEMENRIVEYKAFPTYQYTYRVLNEQVDHSEGEPVYGKDINAYCDPNRNTIHYVAEIRNYDMNGIIDRERGAHLYVSRYKNGIPCYVQVNAPNGNNTYTPGSIIQIRWQGDWKHALRQDIFWTHDWGQSWNLIASVGENNRGYDWTPPINICSDGCKIQIKTWLDVNTPLVDLSDDYFSIKPPLPSAPWGLSAGSTNEDLVDLYWVHNNSYVWEQGFGVWRRLSGQGYSQNWTLYHGPSELGGIYWGDNTITRGATYYYKVLMQDYCGNWSPESNEAGPVWIPWISNPVNLNATALSHNQVHIEFGDASRWEDGYIIQRRIYPNGSYGEVGRIPSTQPPNDKRNTVTWDDVNNLQHSTKYEYRVLGFDNQSHYSDYSLTDTVTTRGYLSSTHDSATAYNNGRKIVRDDVGRLHMVYSDGGYINYTYSSNNGYTWSPPEYWMEPLRTPNTFAPAIAVGEGSNPWVYIAYIGWWKTPSLPCLIVVGRNPSPPNGDRWQKLFVDNRGVLPQYKKIWGPPALVIDSENWPHAVWKYWTDDPDHISEVCLWHWWLAANGAHLQRVHYDRPNDGLNPSLARDEGGELGDLWMVYESTGSSPQVVPSFNASPYTNWWYDDLQNLWGVHPSIFSDGRLMQFVWERGNPNKIYSATYHRDWLIWDPVMVPVSDISAPNTYPSIVNNYCTWADNISNNWEIYYSKKVGDLWSPRINISQSSASSKYPHAIFYQYGKPVFNKYLGVVWTEGNSPPYQVKYQSIRLPWDVAWSTSEAGTGYNNAKRFLADGQGNLYLSYTSKDSVFFISSTDGGDSWSSPTSLGYGTHPALNFDERGNPCVTWRVMDVQAQRLHVYFARRVQNTWQVTEAGNLPMPGIAYITPLSVAVGRGDTAHVCFEYIDLGLVEPWRIYYGNFLTDSPQLTSLMVLDSLEVSPDTLPTSPSLGVDSRGIVHCVWSDPWGEIQYRKQVQGIWTSKVNLSNSRVTASNHPTLSAFGPVAVAWQEEISPGAADIFYRTLGDSLFSPIQNMSNTPQASSEFPIISGAGVLWSEAVNGDYEVYQTKFDSETMTWTEPGSASVTDANSKHPQVALFQNEGSTWAYTVWTEEVVPDQAYQILFTGQELPSQPCFALDLGQSQPSPFLVQRDGFIQYGSEPAMTVDYDTTELVYHLTNLNPFKKAKLLLSFYHQSQDNWKMKLEADQVSLGMAHVPSGQEVVFEKWLPPCVFDDGEVTLRIKRERGDFAVLGKLLVYEYAQGRGGGGPQSAEGAIPMPFPTVFGMAQSYPNPMNDNATIRYQLPVETLVSLKIYNVTGQLVRTLREGKEKPGYYVATWDGKDHTGHRVASGVYLYRMEAGDFMKTRKLVVLR